MGWRPSALDIIANDFLDALNFKFAQGHQFILLIKLELDA
jgi:hypothetical protein